MDKQRICIQCSVGFICEDKRPDRGRFCGKQCFNEWRSINYVGEGSPSWKGGPKSEHRRTKLREYMRKWRAAHPERRRAHGKVKKAVDSGKLIKLPCSICGSTKSVEGHHNDYSKPLDVVWLCKAHHLVAHGNMLR